MEILCGFSKPWNTLEIMSTKLTAINKPERLVVISLLSRKLQDSPTDKRIVGQKQIPRNQGFQNQHTKENLEEVDASRDGGSKSKMPLF